MIDRVTATSTERRVDLTFVRDLPRLARQVAEALSQKFS